MTISHRPHRILVLAALGSALSASASASPFLLFDLLAPSEAQRFGAPSEPAAQPPPYLSQPGMTPLTQPTSLQPSPVITYEPNEDNERAAQPRFQRQVVDYPTREPPGTIVIDTPNTQLYYVLAGGKAIRYGIGVGREGFTWSGVETITRKTEWPDWTPPDDMIRRQPYLPRFMAGGVHNPLGARAMYLGSTMYRIHGTNAPSTIGGRVSSGCIRLVNADVIDLFARVKVGTRVVVLPTRERRAELRRGL